MKYCSSALENIVQITHQNTLDIDIKQNNRHCILLNANDGKEAFYFSTPIYNYLSGELVKRKFTVFNDCYQMIGSNCIVQVTNSKVRFYREDKAVVLNLGRNVIWELNEGCLISDTIKLIPSYNGMILEGDIGQRSFNIKTNFYYNYIKKSKNCICFMESDFVPIFVVSAVKTQQMNGKCCPLCVNLKEESQSMSQLEFFSSDGIYTTGVIEMNFYESKIIQDTPVSQKHPRENNAFGPIGFIGNSQYYGTQWLYSRLDIEKMPELKNKYIRSIKLYISKFNYSSMPMDMIELPNRFCSFGTTWNNKVRVGNRKHKIITQGEYICIDVSDLYTNNGQLQESAGMVVAPANIRVNDYQAISTGDSYAAPPIICVKYSNL